MSDKRWWASNEQREFLSTYVPQYLDAQKNRQYHKFWPKLFQAWFTKFPEAEPTEDDPTDSELELDSEPDANSDDESDSPGSKRKRSRKKTNAKKLAKRVCFIYSSTCVSADSSNRWPRRPLSLLLQTRYLGRRAAKFGTPKRSVRPTVALSIAN